MCYYDVVRVGTGPVLLIGSIPGKLAAILFYND